MIKAVLKDAIKKFHKENPECSRLIEEKDLRWMAFPMVFGSAVGPFNTAGGQVMTAFQIFLIQCDCSHNTLIYADEKFWKAKKGLAFEHPRM